MVNYIATDRNKQRRAFIRLGVAYWLGEIKRGGDTR